MTDNRRDAIEGYLTVLRGELRLNPRHVRRTVAEVGDHLEDAAADLVASGVPRPAAEAHVTARFGDPAELARGVEPLPRRA